MRPNYIYASYTGINHPPTLPTLIVFAYYSCVIIRACKSVCVTVCTVAYVKVNSHYKLLTVCSIYFITFFTVLQLVITTFYCD